MTSFNPQVPCTFSLGWINDHAYLQCSHYTTNTYRRTANIQSCNFRVFHGQGPSTKIIFAKFTIPVSIHVSTILQIRKKNSFAKFHVHEIAKPQKFPTVKMSSPRIHPTLGFSNLHTPCLLYYCQYSLPYSPSPTIIGARVRSSMLRLSG